MDNNNSEEPDMKRRRTNDSSISNAGIIGIDSFSSDIAIRFASYLSSRDLVSLALTCRRFGSSNKNIKSLSLSLVETTARQIICNAKQDERDNLPANRTYIEKYNELEKYRGPLIFHQFIGKDISYVDNDKSYVKLHSDCECDMPSNTAISNHVMRAGKHYVTFTKEISNAVRIGIVRPLPNWDKKGLDEFDPVLFFQPQYVQERIELISFVTVTERWGHSTFNYCSLMVGVRRTLGDGVGKCFSSDWVNSYKIHTWDGVEDASFQNSDKIGMLLDLDAGILSVYKNGRRLGTMVDGLSGEYCWVATMWTHAISATIEKGCVHTD